MTEPRRAATLRIASAGTLLVLVAFTTVVTTVVPTVRGLHGGSDARTWVLGGMSLGLAAGLLAAGALADALGRRKIFAVSIAAMMGASVLAALAPSISVLTGARVLEGFAGAGVLAAGLGMIGHAFPRGPARTHATGVWGAAVGGGIALGPAVSALLASSVGWRGGHWAVAVAALLLLPWVSRMVESRAVRKGRRDLLGAATFALAMGCLTAGLTLGRSGWTRPGTIVLLAGSLVSLTAFTVAELRSDDPLLDLGLLRRPLFVASLTGALFTGLGLIALMSFMPTMLEEGMGRAPLASAGILAIWSAPSMVVAMLARHLPPAVDSPRRLAVGLVLCAGGALGLSALTVHASLLRLAPGLLVAGVGSGVANAALGRLAVESVAPERAAMGSGANNTARYLGGAAGIAILAAVVAVGDHRSGPSGLVDGWNLAATTVAAVCLLGATVAALCRNSTKGAPDVASHSQ